MASSYSTNLGLTLMAVGENADTWGDITNDNLGILLEQAISGYVTQAVATGTDTTITIPDGGTGVARNMYIELTGTGGAATNLIVPAKKKLYFIYNNSTGAVTVKVAGQTGVSVANGKKVVLVCDGTDVVAATSYIVSPANLASDVTGTLPVANGGTGQTSYTNGQLLIGNSTGNTLTKATLTAGTGIAITNGTGSITIATSGGLTGTTNTNVTILGVAAGSSITTGFGHTLIGAEAGKDMTGGAGNTCVGDYAGENITTGSSNTCIGRATGGGITTQSNSTYLGHGAGSSRTGADNTGLGFQALGSFGSGYSNTAVGYNALNGLGSGYQNVAVGNGAGVGVSTGYQNVLIGGGAGQSISTNIRNTAVGTEAYYASGNYTNSSCFGYNAQVTGDNQVQLGDSSTTTYAYGAVQNRSDERDKADIRDTQLGLDFILALRPRDFKWDMREDYRPPAPGPDATQEEMDAWRESCKLSNLTHDGTHTRTRYHQGLIAQEVKQTMDAMGVDFGGYQDHTIKNGDAVLSIGYEELVAPLIKAIQELKAEFDEYKRTHP